MRLVVGKSKVTGVDLDFRFARGRVSGIWRDRSGENFDSK